MMFVALVGGTSIAEEAAAGAGQDTFLAQKCNSCHAVPSVGIESKTQSPAMKGPDMPTAAIKAADVDRDALLKYIRKEAEFDGKKHKKGAKATDDELNTIVDWLITQETAAAK